MLSVRWMGHGGFVSGRLKVAMVVMLRKNSWVLWNDLFASRSLVKIDDTVRDRSAMWYKCFSPTRNGVHM